ncbi:MAG: response regulator [Gallionellaceae bacterium]|nr:response regulator [Gallionellaceae bacterium]
MNAAKPFVVLLVEDEPADAHLVRIALRENRLLVDLHVAGDGVEALQFLRHQEPFGETPRPDLILLDLNMPRMDGREFLAVIKNDPALSKIPVVVLTTSDVERDVVASYKLCAASYITKPVDMEQFMAAIRGLSDYWFALVRLPEKGS